LYAILTTKPMKISAPQNMMVLRYMDIDQM